MDVPRDPVDIEHCGRLGTGRPVIVGTDGSSESERGVRFAADVAAALGVELVIVHALGLLGRGLAWGESSERRREWATEQLEGPWSDFVDADGPPIRTLVVDGPSSLALMRVADDEDGALIVVGSHGAGRSGDPFLGSTSHRIIADSHRPVIVVPPGDNHSHRRSGAGAMSDVVADID